MCYNCGCGDVMDDHGDDRNITDKTFQDAAKATELPESDVKRNIVNLLKKKAEAN